MSKSTPENKAKDLVKKSIQKFCAERSVPYKINWNAGVSYGEQSLDATGVIGGIAVAIEVKRFDGKGKLTGRQKLTLREWSAAGAAAFLIEDQASLEDFILWLNRCTFFKQGTA